MTAQMRRTDDVRGPCVVGDERWNLLDCKVTPRGMLEKPEYDAISMNP